MYGTVRVGQWPTRKQYRTSGCCTGYTVLQRAGQVVFWLVSLQLSKSLMDMSKFRGVKVT